MPAGDNPGGKSFVRSTLRSLAPNVLVLLAAVCVYLSLAAIDFQRVEDRWTFWTIDAVVGLSCLLGAGWLLRTRGTIRALASGTIRALVSVLLLLIAAACVFQSFAAMEAPRESWWIFWTVDAVVGFSCLLGAGWLLRTRRTTA
jgi:hypothetical protein